MTPVAPDRLRIDHLLTKAQSPAQAGDWFERCGFTVTPLSVITSMGLCNRLVLFAPAEPGCANFIELMGQQPGLPTQAAMAQLLAGDEGTRSMVLVADDAHAARAGLLARGFAPGEVHHVTRQWELPGQTLDLAFDVLLPLAAPLAFNVCRYHTLEHYLRPQWTEHPNGVRRLAAVLGVLPDLEAAAGFYERVFGCTAQRPGPGRVTLQPGAVALELYGDEAYARAVGQARPPGFAGFAGYRLACDAPGVTAGWFRRAGVPVQELGGASCVRAFGNDVLLG